MPDFLRVADGVVAKNRIDEAETAQFDALKKAVLAGQAKRVEEEQERRLSQGLPAELSPEEKKELKRQEKAKREAAKDRRKEAIRQSKGSGAGADEEKGSKFLGLLCFGTR